jgi:G3E family GTPase
LKTILVIGPIGSGKTTLAGNLFRSGLLPGKCAFVFNDDGTPETVDAAIVAGGADFRPMNSGCFGCRDVTQFKALMQALESGGEYDFTVIEPLGFVEGSEVPLVLKECGITPNVIALLDVKHLKQNDLLGIVPSQLRVGDIIALTKYPPNAELGGEALEETLEYAGRHAPGKPIVLLPPDGQIPQEILNVAIAKKTAHKHEHKHCSCKHHHHHHGSHDHDHGFFTYSFLLKSGTTFQTVQNCIQNCGSGIVRVKGVAEGRQFHMVHGDWQITIPDSSPPFVTFYSTLPVATDGIAEIAKPAAETLGTTKTLVRTDAIPAEQNVELIKAILEKLPKEALVGIDGPITNPELHELLNEVRKRPGVPPDLNAEAIRARVTYYLKVATILTPQGRWWNHPASGRKKYDLAVGIGWFAQNKPAELGAEIAAEAAQVDLTLLLAEGLLAFGSHNPDLKVAVEMAHEVKDVVRFIGRKHNTRLEEAVAHCLTLAQNREPELISAWQEVAQELQA